MSMLSAGTPFDTVVVPDFLSSAAAFEARTLLFLASWMEHAGLARSFPLHLACIGEPPASVRWLAQRAGARVSVHAPFLSGGPANKQRGWEIAGETDHVLLLDADIWVVGDPAGPADFRQGIALSPEGMPQISESTWQRIYQRLGVPFPTERLVSVAVEAGARPGSRPPGFPGQWAEARSMVPYYNSGVVWAPWDSGLPTLWPEYIRAFRQLPADGPEHPRWIHGSDQGALAVAVQVLRERGAPFHRLPVAYHTHWLHLDHGQIRWRDVRLYHAIGAFRHLPEVAAFRSGLSQYLRGKLKAAMPRVRHDIAHGHWIHALRYLLSTTAHVVTVRGYVERLYRKHIIPAQEASRGGS